MDQAKLKAILESHGKWLRDEGGEKANLRGADLRGANMHGANLCMANLYEADLEGADLHEADLSKANLRGANLRDADLFMANLFMANLCMANLRGADLRGADLRGANLRDVYMNENIIQVGPIGSRRDYTIFWVDQDIVQCGCWNDYVGGSLEDFKQRVDKTYPADKKDTLQYRNEYLAAIAMFERLRDDAGKSL